MDSPTTMTVNCTPFLTLFPLRRPAKDIVVKMDYLCDGVETGMQLNEFSTFTPRQLLFPQFADRD
jgi:hypothetical protein